ncbi:TPA: chromate transporter [Burkholderia vietnamiensis]|uniref:chromate transporter n=1 Tax=Burkholderia vietnamiensis TaxID=60552 RepID=UPI000753B7DB|nr:chromate transporter [Burkholderia vietnamiensis]KVS20064.1 chromate transporter [Burkholderia vietnamiensis]MBR8015404.1 chromate transporter [Burkholderia vietnamiensis]MBR8032109.1 chromate transporter [Burkholderia vietnamiensis]HDR9044304.1 chromate transporter [Burkholderia vietnamiensis]HDR9194094.1 chromate transporter [Burkholderia vietnamiensis]
MPTAPTSVPDAIAPPPGVLALFAAFAQIGLTSFGGGLSGRMMRAFVHERRWLDEEAFLNGLALSQALPGVNVKNLAIWIGYRLAGWRGAVAGFTGVIAPPAVLIVLFGVALSALTRFTLAHVALAGAAAAAIGLSISMAITAVRRLPRRALPLTVMTLTFVSVAVLHWPLVWTVVIGGTLSVALEYRRAARTTAGGSGQ